VVLLINIAASVEVPSECVELPPWRYEQPALTLWVKTITSKCRWTTETKSAFLRYLHAGADSGSLYDRMRNAIEFLRGSPEESKLPDWMSP
jgi:hypothetical protein